MDSFKTIVDVAKNSTLDALGFALAGFGIYGGNQISGHPDNVRIVAEIICNVAMIIGVTVVGGNLLVLGWRRIIKNIRNVPAEQPEESPSASA